MIQSVYIKTNTNEICNLGKTTSFNMEEINDETSIGKKVKYFRKINNVRITNMATELGIGYNTIVRLEEQSDNRNLNHKSIQIINKIIDYLEIRDKLNFNNNDYLDFILNKQSLTIKKLKDKIVRMEIASELNINPDSVNRWITSDVVISRKHYHQIKKMLETK